MYIPDLFGAYIKGRELAIEKNWQDLKNYEAVEHARNQNDLEALQILGERADFGGKRSMFQDKVNQSKLESEVAEYAQPGFVSRADMFSKHAQDQRSVYLNSRPIIQQVMQQMVDANLGSQSNAAAVQNYANKYWTTERQYNAGQARSRAAYNANMTNAAASTYQLRDINNDIANQSDMNALTKANISTEQLKQAMAEQDMINQAHRNYIVYLQAAQAGDQMAAQAASRLAEQFGFSPPTDPTGKTLIPTPAQQANNTQAATDNLTTYLQDIAVNYPYLAAPQPVTSTPVTSTPVAKSSLFGGALGITGTIPRP